MTALALAGALATASSGELVAARALLHRAGSSRRRLGIDLPGLVLDGPWPAILAATCVDISDELSRRGEGLGRCPACCAEIGVPA